MTENRERPVSPDIRGEAGRFCVDGAGRKSPAGERICGPAGQFLRSRALSALRIGACGQRKTPPSLAGRRRFGC